LRPAQCPLTLGKYPPGTQWIGGWMDNRAGLEAVTKRKISVPTDKWTPVIQTVAWSLYWLSYPGSC
jgi:hypothetical protein